MLTDFFETCVSFALENILNGVFEKCVLFIEFLWYEFEDLSVSDACVHGRSISTMHDNALLLNAYDYL